jgi:pimeloyl-ACP methyl ester carboxylesterase
MVNSNPAGRHRRPLLLNFLLALAVLLASLAGGGLASANSSDNDGRKPTIVLVHGDWADGSSWSGVVQRLENRGYTVVAPPNPLRGPSSDVPYLASFLRTIPGPIVLVGHSYCGFVITNAATGNTNVKALVYVDAFIPDVNQTLSGLSAADSCADPSTAFNAVPLAGGGVDVYLRIAANPPYTGFAQCFANGVNQDEAAVLGAVQRPAALAQLAEPSGPPAWEDIRAWALIGTADHVLPPAQQQAMAIHAGAKISTVNAGHLSLVTRPDAVTKLIVTAANATT